MKKLIKNEICGSMYSAHVHCSLHKVNICGYCSMNSNHKYWFSAVNRAYMHCSRTHKFHFLSIFSLKMGTTSLFTYLKIILLQCFQFSVFNFSKINSIQTHLWEKTRKMHAFWIISIKKLTNEIGKRNSRFSH